MKLVDDTSSSTHCIESASCSRQYLSVLVVCFVCFVAVVSCIKKSNTILFFDHLMRKCIRLFSPHFKRRILILCRRFIVKACRTNTNYTCRSSKQHSDYWQTKNVLILESLWDKLVAFLPPRKDWRTVLGLFFPPVTVIRNSHLSLNQLALYLQSLAAKPQSAFVDAVTDLFLFTKEVEGHVHLVQPGTLTSREILQQIRNLAGMGPCARWYFTKESKWPYNSLAITLKTSYKRNQPISHIGMRYVTCIVWNKANAASP